MVDSTSVSTIILLTAASALLLAAMLFPSSLQRWFQRKRYQYEVTFSLYMLTSTEKFIFSMFRPMSERDAQAARPCTHEAPRRHSSPQFMFETDYTP